MSIPISERLQETIDAAPSGQLAFVVTKWGKPYSSANSFGGAFRGWCKQAGLPKGRGIHGLRKRTSAKLADRGAKPHQIQALTSHTTLKEVARYTKSADQKKLADDAVEILSDERDGNKSVPLSDTKLQSGTNSQPKLLKKRFNSMKAVRGGMTLLARKSGHPQLGPHP